MKKVLEFDLEGNFIKEWNNTHEPEEFFGFTRGGVSNCCRMCNHLITLHNRFWLYKEDYDKDNSIIKNRIKIFNEKQDLTPKPVVQFTKDGEFVAKYSSVREAGRITGFRSDIISNSCLNKQKKVNKFIFLFKEDYDKDKSILSKRIHLLKQPLIITKHNGIEQIDKNGDIVKVYKTLKECDEHGFNSGNVGSCCRGNKPQYKGYTWRYRI